MATTKFYHDTRATGKGKPAPLKLSITRKGATSLLNLGVKITPSQWDERAQKIVAHPQKQFLNSYLSKRKLAADECILTLRESGEISGMSARQIRDKINAGHGQDNAAVGAERPLFAERFKRYAETAKKDSTRRIYLHTYNSIAKFDNNFFSLGFEDITKAWLVRYEKHLRKTSPSQNARNIHLRNIRAVFNEAIDDEITTHYPFRKFKIRNVATAKRALTVEQLRLLFTYEPEPFATQYIDMFKLIFFLIGINIIDLCGLKQITTEGRVEYRRSKTGRLYSIKVEPEAREIIEKYRGENQLLNILDRYVNYKDYANRLNRNLKKIGKVERKGRGGKKIIEPLFPELTTYWARHTWASIAAELDIPKETIAAALGHSIGNPTASIYIDFNRDKIDAANRQVMDYVLYGRKPQTLAEALEQLIKSRAEESPDAR